MWPRRKINTDLRTSARLAVASLALGAVVSGCGSSPEVGGPLELELSDQIGGAEFCSTALGNESFFFAVFMLYLDSDLLRDKEVQITGFGRIEADLPFEAREVLTIAEDGTPVFWTSVDYDSSGEIETVGQESYEDSAESFVDLPATLPFSDGPAAVSIGAIFSATDKVDLSAEPPFLFNTLEYSVDGKEYVLEGFERKVWLDTVPRDEYDGGCPPD